MGRPSPFDGAFVIRLSKQEMAEAADPRAYLEEIIRQCKVDPDTCTVTVKESATAHYWIYTIKPNTVEP